MKVTVFIIGFRGVSDPYQTSTQPFITCSKLTIETLEQGVKCAQCVQGVNGVVLACLLLT